MKVLVTGHKGFIGSNLYARLAESNHIVSGVDKVDGYDIRFLSAADYPNVDAVVHCAAIADVRDNWAGDGTNRDAVWSHNVDGTRNLLESLPNVPHIFMSTAAVYGSTGRLMLEDNACRPNSPYGASKVAAEALYHAWGARYGVKHSILRLGCVVGAGYAHGHISDFVRQAKLGVVKPKTVGFAKRSYVHVDDVCQAVNGILLGKISPGTYNLSAGSWACRDTAREMRLEGHAIEWPTWREGWDGETGWTGDNHTLLSSTAIISQGWRPTKSVSVGVNEALYSLGWRK
jgi:UDP-glucose 4-epimerase